jgi:zinc protease
VGHRATIVGIRTTTIALIACFWPGALSAQQIQVREHTLANGMKLLVHEDHDIPNVALYLFFKVGSRDERPGTTGLSHFFEHMMFNGARKFGPKQFDIQMERNGGANNAYTSRDITAYTDWFPRTALELMFDMEADRIAHLAIDPKMVESERGVVYSERRLRVDNSNEGTLREQLDATAYTAHPYQFPVIGWPSDIEGWTLDDLKAHFRMGYAPNNCVAVVAGDVSDAAALALAKRYLEPIPRQPPPPKVRTREPAQLGERRLTVRKQAQNPLVMASWHVSESRHADRPALKVMDAILSEGRSSRLHRRLVDRDRLAFGVSTELDDAIDPGQWIANLQVRPGVDPAAAEKALHEEIERVASGGVGEAEVAKARNQLLTVLFRQLKTIAGKANQLGQAEVFYGGWSRVNAFAAEFDKVTPVDVKRVAALYLKPTNRTVAVLVPEDSK